MVSQIHYNYRSTIIISITYYYYSLLCYTVYKLIVKPYISSITLQMEEYVLTLTTSRRHARRTKFRP